MRRALKALASQRSSHSCACETSTRWPVTSFKDPIDEHSYLTKIGPFHKHVLINTPNKGAHQWKVKPDIGKNGAVSLLAACTSVMAPGKPLDNAVLNRNSQKLLINQYSHCTHVESDQYTEIDADECQVRIFPDGYEFSAHADKIEQMLTAVLNNKDDPVLAQKSSLRVPHIYICAHLARDSRCGYAGPVLAESARTFVQSMTGPAKETQVSFIDHMGGHKFAGNVLFYIPDSMFPGDNGEGTYSTVWYGRANLSNLEDMIQTTFRGKTIHEFVRYSSGRYRSGNNEDAFQ